MAGPAASVILKDRLSVLQKQDIRQAISERASMVDGHDFWVDERLFIINIGPEYDGELDDYNENGVPDMIGWVPFDVVGFAAMSNRKIDHQLLAELCLYFARRLDGLIDFGGELPCRTQQGQLFSVSYESANHEVCTYHIGDVKFLEHWLKQPEFRMVK